MIFVENYKCFRGDGVMVCRPHVLGNPYIVGAHGSRDQCIENFRRYLWRHLRSPGGPVFDAVARLADRHRRGETIVLLCACAPAPCHGDVIKAAIEWLASTDASSIPTCQTGKPQRKR